MRIRRVEATVRQRRLRVAAYCRVSTKRAEQEDSLEVQQSVYERFIRSNPAWEFAGLYTDARSGLSTEKREGFMRMIEDAKAGRIDLILCKSISRFSRNIVECQRFVELLRSRNVAVLFEKEHIRTDEPTSNLIFSLMCAIAQDESRSISENMQTANRHRVEAGIYTPRQKQMLGYDVKDGRFVPNANACIIQHIFTQYAEGVGIEDICRELDGQKARRYRAEKPFTHQIVRHILSNESYVGDKRLQKKPPCDFLTKKSDPTRPYSTNYLTDDHEAIVSRELWNAAQERLKREADAREIGVRRQGNSHELYGRIFCEQCGEPYVQRTFTKRAVKQDGSRYYKVWCCRGRRNGNGCKNPNVLDEKLQEETRSAERYFVTRLGEIVKTT